ncbi:MAG: hypothetical protein RL591_95 [Planctomycetota bacterium]
MTATSLLSRRSLAACSFAIATISTLSACSPQDAKAPVAAEGSSERAAANNAATDADKNKASLAASPARRVEIARFGYDVASMIPTEGNVRDQAKAQEWCVAAMIALGDRAGAEEMANSMRTWRRAACYADIGLSYARAGETAKASEFAERALKSLPEWLDWQQERIRVKVAQVYVVLGESGRADELAKGVGEPEIGKVEMIEATRADEAEFDARLAEIEAWLATGNFDLARNALDVSEALYGRFVKDAARRTKIEDVVRRLNAKVPFDLRVASLLELARTASKAGDAAHALELVAEAKAEFAKAKWLPEDFVTQMALLGTGEFEAGDSAGARKTLDEAVVYFQTNRDSIVDIFRGAPLRLVAKGYATLGNDAKAREIFALAINEGAINGNARPRAEDLAAACADLATTGVEPGEELWARMAEIRAGLRAPW